MNTPRAYTYGKQSIKKFNEDKANEVNIFIAVWRLNNKYDIVLHVNDENLKEFESTLSYFDKVIESFNISNYSLFVN